MNTENKNIVKLIVRGQTNRFGNLVYDYANKIVLAGLGAKANFYMGIYQSSEVIAGVLFNLIGGVVADRNNRKRVLIITDLIAGIATFLVFLFYSKTNVWLFTTTNILLAILFAFNSPAYKAVIKDLLSKKNIYRYNSLSKTIAEILGVFSPLFGMIIIKVFGFKYGMLINSISFFLSAVITWSFKEIVPQNTISSKKEPPIVSLKGGFRYIFHDKELLIVLVASSFINLFYAGYAYSIPFTNLMSGKENMFALILTFESIGNIIGASLNGFFKFDMPARSYSRLLLGVAVPVLLIPFVSFSNLIILIFCGISSAFMTIFNIQMMSGIQAKVDSEYLGRVFSVIFTVAIVFMPIGTAFFSILNMQQWFVFGIVGVGELLVFTFMNIAIKYISKT